MRRRNPIHHMDSVEALDLLVECKRLFLAKKEASLELLDRLREQILRHRRALRNIIGTEAV